MNWEIITAISSAVIALCALVYSVFQGKLLQKHNKLTFRPHIDDWGHSEPQNGFYYIDLLNNGLGPAIIKDFTLSVDGVTITGQGTQPIEKALRILFPDTNYDSHQSSLAINYVLGAKEKCRLIAIQFTKQPFPRAEAFRQILNRANLNVVYHSFYGEEFQYDSSKNEMKNITTEGEG